MANTNSAELAQVAASPADPIDVSAFGGRIRYQQATITFAAQAPTDTINLFKIPAGGRVISLCTIATVSHGATATIAIGDSTDAAKFRAAATLTATALTAVVIPGTAATAVGFGTPYTTTTTILATIGAAALPASGTAIYQCYYVVD